MEILILLTVILPFWLVSRRVVKNNLSDVIGSRLGIDLVSLVMGLGLLCLSGFLLGIFHLYRPLFGWLSILLVALSAFYLYGKELPLKVYRGLRFYLESIYELSPVHKVLLSCFAVLILFNLLGAYLPQIGEDALAYHYALPKVFIREGGLIFFPYDPYSVTPMNIDMLFTLGMLLGNATVSNLFCWLIGIAFAGAVYWLVSSYFGRSQGILWSLITYSMPLVMRQSHQALVDIGVGLFALTGATMIVMAIRTDNFRRSVFALAGFFYGIAAGSKLFGIVSAVASAVALLGIFLLWERKRKIVVPCLVMMFTTGVVVSPWYVRSAFHTGNPVYPAFYSILGGKYWDQTMDEKGATHHINNLKDAPAVPLGKSLIGLATLPLYFSYPRVIADYFQKRIKTEQPVSTIRPPRPPTSFRPEMSFLEILFLPFAFVALRRRKISRATVYIMLSSFLFITFWHSFLPQEIRHLAPILPFYFLLAAAGAGYLLEWKGNRLIQRATVVIIGIWLATSLGMHSLYYLPKAYGAVSPERYLKQYSFYYPSIDWINSHLREGSKLAIVSEMLPYYLNVPYIHLGPSFRLTDFKDASSLAAFLKERGITHIFVTLDSSSGGYLFTFNNMNTIINLFRSNRLDYKSDEERSEDVKALMDLLSDSSKTILIHQREEQGIDSRTPLTYGRPIRVAIYQLLAG